ncbi:MAG: glycosyltransferase family 4 protein [Acidobacteria bacterium]|nr:glycosyltransferase family 4 protein [Acidobacteriota bacterium]
MRILSITAGAAGMYCGSCSRDNAFARELLDRGHDVQLLPVYTPIRTDEPSVSQPRVFFGGVSVYLQQHVPFFRRSPWILDRLWDAPALIRLVSKRAISTDPGKLGDLTVSVLRGEDGHQRKEIDKLLHWLRAEPRPDIVNLPNSLLIGLARPLAEALECPICCTLQGEDLFIDGLPAPQRQHALELIRDRLAFVQTFVAVSEYYAAFMADYLAIPKDKLRVVPLGINLEGYDARERDPKAPFDQAQGRPFTIGYFARIGQEKGLHVLAAAYTAFRKMPGVSGVRLEAAGYLARAQAPYLAAIERDLKQAGLGDEFSYRGELDRRQKIAFLQGLDVLSVPTVYAEPKGTFLLEAMACGVPVVQPRHGAFDEIVTKTGGGLLVERGDPKRLAEGLYTLWRDRNRARLLGAQGRSGVQAHYSIARSADRLLDVYREIVGSAQWAVGSERAVGSAQ